MLTGKYKAGAPPPAGSRAVSPEMSGFLGRLMTDDVLAKVDRLRPIAEQAGMSLPHLALAWVLRRPELASAIVGASRPEQVRSNAAASGVVLADDVIDAIDEALAGVVIRGPSLAAFAQEGVKHR